MELIAGIIIIIFVVLVLDSLLTKPRYWELNNQVEYVAYLSAQDRSILKTIGVTIDNTGRIVAAKGTKTDLASVPKSLWWLITPWDTPRAAIIHDVIYDKIRKYKARGGDATIANWARAIADNVFKQAMEEADPPVAGWKKFLSATAVDLFGALSTRVKRK